MRPHSDSARTSRAAPRFVVPGPLGMMPHLGDGISDERERATGKGTDRHGHRGWTLNRGPSRCHNLGPIADRDALRMPSTGGAIAIVRPRDRRVELCASQSVSALLLPRTEGTLPAENLDCIPKAAFARLTTSETAPPVVSRHTIQTKTLDPAVPKAMLASAMNCDPANRTVGCPLKEAFAETSAG